MKSRKLGIGLLLLLALTVTTGTFAYWASSITDADTTGTGTVAIGTGQAVTTTVAVTNQTGGPLVPVDQTGTNNVNLTFPVLWTSDNAATGDDLTGVLAVTVDSIEIDGTDYSGLFTVTISSGTGAITEDASQDVVVNVEFTLEPADADEYTDVTSDSLIVTLSFDVTAND